MVLTRLLNLSSMTLEEFEIDQMPEYVAMSHVWSESLFPVPNLTDTKVEMCDGIKMLLVVQETNEEVARIQYCWTDTWCIDQNDPEDKNSADTNDGENIQERRNCGGDCPAQIFVYAELLGSS
jgi:hypothetical protein